VGIVYGKIRTPYRVYHHDWEPIATQFNHRRDCAWMESVEEEETFITEAVWQSCVLRARDGARGLEAATEVLVSSLHAQRIPPIFDCHKYAIEAGLSCLHNNPFCTK
jgi:hypothetical protein